ncbi:MAG: mechanosensitive ion channel [Lachnospiraceae bacterium]|nr:mechanosensitive ion channel [Lachnospiraceae bacterium]
MNFLGTLLNVVTESIAATEVTAAANPIDIVKAGLLKKYIEDLGPKALNVGIRIVIAIILFIVGLQLIKLVRKLISKAMEKAKADAGVKGFVDSFVNAALFVLLILLIAIQCGVDAASIVAIIGSAGVAIGLAVQGSLSNLIGGILILILKPFTVGDYIIDSGSGKEGTVIEIKIFHTRLRTFDNKIVVLPNGNLANNVIVNVTKEKTRRIDVICGISYNADIDKAKAVLLDMLENDESVLKDKEHRVVVSGLKDSSVELTVRFWVKSRDYWDAYYRITENTKKTLDANEISIPFPQLDVHINNPS